MNSSIGSKCGGEDDDGCPSKDDDNDDTSNDFSNPLNAFDDDLCQALTTERTPTGTIARKSVASRNWGIPTFSDQIDKNITAFTLERLDQPEDCSNEMSVTVRLQHRLHSTGSDLWDAALVLAHALYQPSFVRAVTDQQYSTVEEWFSTIPNIIELGSGTGALGLFCAKCLGGKNGTNNVVTLTDLPGNLTLIQSNAQHNGIPNQTLAIIPLDWTQPILDCSPFQKCSLILGTDLCKF